MVKQLVDAPKTVSQDRIQQRTVEQIVDVPFPQAVEVFRVFSKDRIQQRAVEQTIDTLATSLEMIVEVLSFGRKKRRNRLRTRMFSTSSTQLKQRCPKSSRRQCRERSP